MLLTASIKSCSTTTIVFDTAIHSFHKSTLLHVPFQHDTHHNCHQQSLTIINFTHHPWHNYCPNRLLPLHLTTTTSAPSYHNYHHLHLYFLWVAATLPCPRLTMFVLNLFCHNLILQCVRVFCPFAFACVSRSLGEV